MHCRSHGALIHVHWKLIFVDCWSPLPTNFQQTYANVADLHMVKINRIKQTRVTH